MRESRQGGCRRKLPVATQTPLKNTLRKLLINFIPPNKNIRKPTDSSPTQLLILRQVRHFRNDLNRTKVLNEPLTQIYTS